MPFKVMCVENFLSIRTRHIVSCNALETSIIFNLRSNHQNFLFPTIFKSLKTTIRSKAQTTMGIFTACNILWTIHPHLHKTRMSELCSVLGLFFLCSAWSLTRIAYSAEWNTLNLAPKLLFSESNRITITKGSEKVSIAHLHVERCLSVDDF